jgi:hypothetical protein
MNHFATVPLLAMLLATPLAAETVRVRSGEHEGFSRLVLEFSERPTWRLEERSGAAELVFSPEGWTFDLADVFSRIPRKRVRDLTASENGLLIHLACDPCRIDVFNVRSGAIAIDVRDAPPVALSKVVTTAADSAPDVAAPTVLDVAPELPRTVTSWPILLQDSSGGVVFPFDRLPSTPHPLSYAPSRPQAATDGTDPPVEPPATADIAGRIADEVARAASHGFLRATTPEQKTSTEHAVEAGETSAGRNLRLRQPGDIASPEEDAELHQTDCPAEDVFDIGAWVPRDDTPPADALASAKSALAGELDAIDEARAIDLARLYLSFGFGAEASTVVTTLAPRHPDAQILMAIADIVDGAADGIPDGLDGAKDCPGRARLWVALAGSPPSSSKDVLIALSEVPLGLRRHLAPRLMAVFTQAGDTATAESVRAMVTRAPGPHGSDFELAEARMAATAGSSSAFLKLEGIAAVPSPVSDEALAILLELSAAQDRKVDLRLRELGEARADDLRTSPLGARIEAALIRVMLAADDFPAASARLVARKRSPLDGRIQDDLVIEFFAALAERGPPDAVLIHATTLLDALPAIAAARQVRIALARRLLDLQLPRLARDALGDAESDAPHQLLARQHLVSGSPDRALALLEGTDADDEESTRLRAEALLAVGAPREAMEVFRALNDEGGKETATWRTGDWNLVASTGSGPRADAARLLADTDSISRNTPDSPYDAVLAEASDARQRLETLLETISSP